MAIAAAKALGVTPLVICPKGVKVAWWRACEHLGWQAEIVGWEQARGRRVSYGDRKLVASEWFEEFPSGAGSYFKFRSTPPAMAIFDEVHRAGGNTTLNAKEVKAAARSCKYVLSLSATACDQITQLMALGELMRLYKQGDWHNFLRSYNCRPGVFGGWEEPPKSKQPEAWSRIRSAIYPTKKFGLKKEEIPGFPKTQLGVLELDPPETAEKLGAELRDLYEKRKDQRLSAEERESWLEEATRAKQELELLMIPQLIELAEDYARSSGVVIFANYVNTLEYLNRGLQKALNSEIGIVDGTLSDPKFRDDVVRAFQAGKYPALLVNSQAGGEGLSMHRKTDVTSLILPQSSGRRMAQINGRVQRDGGGFSQQFFVFFGGTVHEKILKVLRGRLDSLETLTEAELSF